MIKLTAFFFLFFITLAAFSQNAEMFNPDSTRKEIKAFEIPNSCTSME